MTESNSPEFVFPPYAIHVLQGMREEEWDQLVERILRSEEGSCEQAAFVLTIVRLAGCVSCQADSFRAMRGCIPCARQVIRRYPGEDEELARQFAAALQQVEVYSSGLED